MALRNRGMTGWNFWELTGRGHGYYFEPIGPNTVLLIIERHDVDEVVHRAFADAERRLHGSWTITATGREDDCMFVRYERVAAGPDSPASSE